MQSPRAGIAFLLLHIVPLCQVQKRTAPRHVSLMFKATRVIAQPAVRMLHKALAPRVLPMHAGCSFMHTSSGAV